MSLIGSTNEEKIWNYLKAKGLPDCGIAGLMGNLYAESCLIPTNLQNSYEKALSFTDAAYTAAVDNGTYQNFVKDKLADDDLLLLSIGGTLYFIADIGLRMLSPRELYNAMGFPPDYIIDRDYMGNPYPKNEQVARCGNAVCPPMAAAVARANFPEYVAKVGDTITTMAALLDMVAV